MHFSMLDAGHVEQPHAVVGLAVSSGRRGRAGRDWALQIDRWVGLAAAREDLDCRVVADADAVVVDIMGVDD